MCSSDLLLRGGRIEVEECLDISAHVHAQALVGESCDCSRNNRRRIGARVLAYRPDGPVTGDVQNGGGRRRGGADMPLQA